MVQVRYDNVNQDNKIVNAIKPGIENEGVLTGDWHDHLPLFLHSLVSNDEVRPKNTAIKIWKRIKC